MFKGFARWEHQGLLDAPVELFLSFALPGVNGHTSGSTGGRSVILSAENVAATPSHLCTQLDQSLDETLRFGSSCATPSDAGTC